MTTKQNTDICYSGMVFNLSYVQSTDTRLYQMHHYIYVFMITV